MMYLVVTVYLGVVPAPYAVEDLHNCAADKLKAEHLIGHQDITVRVTCETDPKFASRVVFSSVDEFMAAIREHAHAR